ncbi:MAG: hypothetical protein Q9162_006676 [Coniocarpon cinnabarinum]
MFVKATALLAISQSIAAFTPEQMLAAPRRSSAVPDPSGASYSFDTHETTTIWKLLDIESGAQTVLPYDGDEVPELAWAGPTNTSIVYLNATAGDIPGGMTMYMADVLRPNDTTLVATLDAQYAGLKAVNTPSGGIAWLTNALAYANGSAYNEELAETPLSTARFYEDIFVRHWDTYLTAQRYALFAGTLEKGADGSFALSSVGVKNLLSGIPAPVTRPETPVQPFGDQGDYDITPDGSTVAFLSKAPQLPKANFTASYIYLVPHDGSAVAQTINGPDSQAFADGHQGASAAPRFSPDGTKIVYAQMDGISYESDKNKVFVADVASPTPTVLAENWDRSPDQMRWSTNSSLVYVGAADIGTEKIFLMPTDASADYVPTNLTQGPFVLDFYTLPSGDILVQDSSIYSSTDYYVLHTADATTTTLFESFRSDPELAGLGPQDYEDFYYEGTFGPQQAWIIKPTGFDPSKQYPLAFWPHGGPQGAWYNEWSTRWNYRVWSDQGYVVIAPNPTGSTSYGQNLTDAIQNNWGSYPYHDLVSCWNYVDANLSYVDTANGINAGASYGGFMTNWIQGHDLGRKFKALVTHDGITSTLSANYGTEELWFVQHDFNGTLWDDRPNYERWDPIAHAKNFSTPHFIVHSSHDYRLAVSEGLFMFNVLQERGVPSRFLNFPDESHWVLGRENSRVWHQEIFNWINHYSGVGGELDDNAIGQ